MHSRAFESAMRSFVLLAILAFAQPAPFASYNNVTLPQTAVPDTEGGEALSATAVRPSFGAHSRADDADSCS